MKEKHRVAGSVLLSVAAHVAVFVVLCVCPSAGRRRLIASTSADDGSDHAGTARLVVTVSLDSSPDISISDFPISAAIDPVERYLAPILEPVKNEPELLGKHRFSQSELEPAPPPAPLPALAAVPVFYSLGESIRRAEVVLPIVQELPSPQRKRRQDRLFKPNLDPIIQVQPATEQARSNSSHDLLADHGDAPHKSADLSANEFPKYPQDAILRQQQGVVLLKLTIDREGRVTDVQVLRSSGHQSLDVAAVTAVQNWRGQPATQFGIAVPSEEVLPIRFRL